MSKRHAALLETLSVEGLPEGAVPAFEAALQTVCATVGLFRDEATDTWRVEAVREAGAGDAGLAGALALASAAAGIEEVQVPYTRRLAALLTMASLRARVRPT